MESVESVQKKVMLLLTKREAEVVVVGVVGCGLWGKQQQKNTIHKSIATTTLSTHQLLPLRLLSPLFQFFLG